MRILLVCSSGASSGFLVQNMKKAAKEQNLDVDIEARSEYELENYLDIIDVVLIGPHLSYLSEEIADKAQQYNVPMGIVPQDIYGTIDGARALAFALNVVNKGGNTHG